MAGMRKGWIGSLLVRTVLAWAGDTSAQGKGKGGGGGGKPPPPPADPAIAYVDLRKNDLMVMNEDGSNQTLVLRRLSYLTLQTVAPAAYDRLQRPL